MRAVILAGGRGLRMGDLTVDRPKALIPVAGKPLIMYSLMAAQLCEITAATIVIGYRGDKIRDALGNGKEYRIEVSYAQQPRAKMDPASILAIVAKDETEVLGFNCDALMTPEEYRRIIEEYSRRNIDGCIALEATKPCRRSLLKEGYAPTSIGIYGPRLLGALCQRSLEKIITSDELSIRGYVPYHLFNVNNKKSLPHAEKFVNDLISQEKH